MVALIGIDCATQPGKVGLALGEIAGEVVRIKACQVGSAVEQPLDLVHGWLHQCDSALLALDAPLGWPCALGARLVGHQAGAGMGAEVNTYFRRLTDDDIYKRFQKRPLEVGANLISRTAVAALHLLEQLRERSKTSIPLAWNPADLNPYAAIEVYPAVTRLAHGGSRGGGSIEGLGRLIDLSSLDGELPLTADARDALVCVIAAADFLRGRAKPPEDLHLAKKEGWIWAAEKPS